MAEVVSGQAELRDLARRLKQQEDYKPRVKRLRQELRKAAQPLLPIIRANARSLPSKGQNRLRGRKSLRSDFSRAVSLQTRLTGRRAGVSVFMNPRKMSDGRKNLTQYFERTPGYTTLSHPVFKRGKVTQITPAAGYFTRSLGRAQTNAEQAVKRVIDDTAQRIES